MVILIHLKCQALFYWKIKKTVLIKMFYPNWFDISTPYHTYCPTLSKLWMSPLYYLFLCLKIAGWVAHGVDLNWKLHSVVSDLGLNYMPRPVRILLVNTCIIQLTLVISTPLISILSLMSNWFLSPDYFPYVFIVFQLRVCRTSFMSTLRLSRPSFSVPEYIFHRFYYRVSRTRTMTKGEKNVRCGAAGLSVNENHNRPLINKSIV